MGESFGSKRRISQSNTFVSVELSVPVSVKSALGQIACPISYQAYSAFVRFENGTVFGGLTEGGLLSINYTSTASFVS